MHSVSSERLEGRPFWFLLRTAEDTESFFTRDPAIVLAVSRVLVESRRANERVLKHSQMNQKKMLKNVKKKLKKNPLKHHLQSRSVITSACFLHDARDPDRA
tara:strand:- start:10607 stop:10912 length:306 start_codon:yes stop_codon:yes gene_type:complete